MPCPPVLGSPFESSRCSALGHGRGLSRARHKARRHVAIKVLPEAVAADLTAGPVRARSAVAAALNHPNIAAVYGVEDSSQGQGRPPIVMELVPGGDLSYRIRRGRSLWASAAPGAADTDALAGGARGRNHHRYLNPNIKVRDEGTVKVLLRPCQGARPPGPPVRGDERRRRSPRAPHRWVSPRRPPICRPSKPKERRRNGPTSGRSV